MTRTHQWKLAWTQDSDGEEAFGEGYGKAFELAVQAVYRRTGAKGGWNGERVATGAHRHTSTTARVKGERIVLELYSGPRPDAEKEEKGKRKVAK